MSEKYNRLPTPVTVEHVYQKALVDETQATQIILQCILSEITAMNELLAACLAPAAPVVGGGGDSDVIELREPKRKRGK